MVINAPERKCESAFMADLKTLLAPDWNKVIDGQINLRDAVNGTISYTNEAGKIYQLARSASRIDLPCTRSTRRVKTHVTGGEAIPGSLFDFACTFSTTIKRRSLKRGPYFTCRKRKPGRGAARWSEVFSYEESLNLRRCAVRSKATPAGLKRRRLFSRWMRFFMRCVISIVGSQLWSLSIIFSAISKTLKNRLISSPL